MSNIPADLRYAASHEWARLEADGSVTVGISDHAQEALGDVVFIELPEVGKQLNAGQEAGVVESVKAASDIYAPVGGEVIAINEALADSPESVNSDPYGSWFFKLKPVAASDLDQLLDAAGYAAAVAQVEADPIGYWTKVAGRLDWSKPFTQVKDVSNACIAACMAVWLLCRSEMALA